MNEIAIAITAVDRPEALSSLLLSLETADIRENIDLIISIDGGVTKKVNEIAERFIWKYGDKKVYIHEKKKGLKNHFIWIGDLTEKYETIIFAEDDMFLSPNFLKFVDEAVKYYKNDNDVAGICLYNPIICEFNGCKFYQLQDGNDIYFLQHPYWGNIWIKNKWKEFKVWLSNYILRIDILPPGVVSWKDSSFKKIYIQYLIECNKFFVIPRISYITNCGIRGFNNNLDLYQFQTPLTINAPATFRFCRLYDSMAVYDAFMEIKPDILKRTNPILNNYCFEVDLKQNRLEYKEKYVLTTKKVVDPVISFSKMMKPQEQAVLWNKCGDGIYMVTSEKIKNIKRDDIDIISNDMNMNYIISIKVLFKLLVEKIVCKIKRENK